MTNNHVVDGASKLKVKLNDGRSFDAKLIGKDSATDLALLKVEAKGLPTLAFGSSDALRLGEWVLAIGSPFDLQSTITAGIVSAKGRSLKALPSQFSLESFIQTDAAVNPGNSGGALALAVADRVLMLENAVYAILSPEGFASILWKDAQRSGEAAELMKLTAPELKKLGVIDGIVREPEGGAQIDPSRTLWNLDRALTACLEPVSYTHLTLPTT